MTVSYAFVDSINVCLQITVSIRVINGLKEENVFVIFDLLDTERRCGLYRSGTTRVPFGHCPVERHWNPRLNTGVVSQEVPPTVEQRTHQKLNKTRKKSRPVSRSCRISWSADGRAVTVGVYPSSSVKMHGCEKNSGAFEHLPIICLYLALILCLCPCRVMSKYNTSSSVQKISSGCSALDVRVCTWGQP